MNQAVFGGLAKQALLDRRAVEMAKDRQCGVLVVAVAVPYDIETEFARLTEVFTKKRVAFGQHLFLLGRIFAPVPYRVIDIDTAGRQFQSFALLGEEVVHDIRQFLSSGLTKNTQK